VTGYDYTYKGEDSYCYPGTSVLRNKLGIRDADALLAAEREITSLKLLLIREKPMRIKFDLNRLRAIHRFIFCDIYEWAGEIRTGEFLSKGKTLFCLGSYIESYSREFFVQLASKKWLRGLGKLEFIRELAYYMGEVNALHPFREGNGRTAREFFRQLSKSAGYDLDFGGVEKEKLLLADIAAFNREYSQLIAILDDIVTLLF
jgi:cell filamentation protein